MCRGDFEPMFLPKSKLDEQAYDRCVVPHSPRLCSPTLTHWLAIEDTSVRQDHQRKGVGSLMLEWGMKKADELGIEGYVEATDARRVLY